MTHDVDKPQAREQDGEQQKHPEYNWHDGQKHERDHGAREPGADA